MSAYQILTIPDFTDSRGSLYVMENLIPFPIKRFFYILNASQIRGGHRHHRTHQAMICMKGSVEIYMNNGKSEETIPLTSPNQCLLIEPQDWHQMKNFSSDCVLLILASELFDQGDYIMENYK
jgi:mannose-6-phosphate isomerase-like protein (cupin superfamily)